MKSLKLIGEPGNPEFCDLVEEEIQVELAYPFQESINGSYKDRFSPFLFSQAASFHILPALERNESTASNTVLVHTISSGPADAPLDYQGNTFTSESQSSQPCGIGKRIHDSCNLRVIRLPDEEEFFGPAQSQRDTLQRDTLEGDDDIEELIVDLFCQDDQQSNWDVEDQEVLLLKENEEEKQDPLSITYLKCKRLKKQLRSVSCSPRPNDSESQNKSSESSKDQQPPPKKRRRRERGFVNVKELKYRELWKGRLSPTSREKLGHLLSLKPDDSLEAMKFIKIPPFPENSSDAGSLASSVDKS